MEHFFLLAITFSLFSCKGRTLFKCSYIVPKNFLYIFNNLFLHSPCTMNFQSLFFVIFMPNICLCIWKAWHASPGINFKIVLKPCLNHGNTSQWSHRRKQRFKVALNLMLSHPSVEKKQQVGTKFLTFGSEKLDDRCALLPQASNSQNDEAKLPTSLPIGLNSWKL